MQKFTALLHHSLKKTKRSVTSLSLILAIFILAFAGKVLGQVPTISSLGSASGCVGSSLDIYGTNLSSALSVYINGTGESITYNDNTHITVTIGNGTTGSVVVNTSGGSAGWPIFTVNALPSPFFTVQPGASACVGVSVTYTTQESQTNYEWTFTGTSGTDYNIVSGGGNTNTVTLIWLTTGSKTVTINYTNNNGCTAASATVKTITVNALPVPTISASASFTTISSESFENNGIVPTGWATEVVSGGNTITFETSTLWPGGYSAYDGYFMVMFNSFTANGGVNRLKKTIPISTIGLTSASVNFAWFESTGYPSLQDRVDVEYSTDGITWATAGTFNRYNTVQGWKNKSQVLLAGALGQATLYIAFKFTSAYGNDCYLDLATITIPSTPICAGNTGTYSTEAGMTDYIWTASAGGAITSGVGTNSIDVLWNTAGPQTVSINYTNANGCTATSETVSNIPVNAIPIPTISGPSTLCAGTIGGTYTTEAGMADYDWTISAGGNITAGASTNTITATWTTAGVQSISVNYVNGNSCTAASATVYNITVIPSPVPTISGNTAACLNSTGNVYTTESGMTAYSWSVNGGTITSGGTATDTSATITWATSGAESISVNYTDGNGCTATSATDYNVTVSAQLPVPTISGSTSACINSTRNYTTEAAMTAYNWSVNGGTITSGAGTNSIDVLWNTPGSQKVSVKYTNSNGCTAATATDYNVTVNALLPVPTISGSTSACINSTGNVYTTEAAMTAYSWSVIGGTITSGGTATNNTATIIWTTAGAQSISINYTNSNGCTAASATVYNVTVNPLPVPTISGNTSACLNSTGNVYTTEAGMTAYSWNVNGGTITSGGTATDNTATITWTSSGVRSINVYYTNGNGCTASTPTYYNVTVNPSPVPTISGNTSACLNSTGNVYTTEAGMTAYSWSVNGGTITSGGTATDNTATVTWTSSGVESISVNYTNSNGCTAASAIIHNVTVNALFVPTITGSATTLSSESFENGGSIPTGWATEVLTAGNTITFVTATSWPAGYTAYDGSYLVKFNSYSVNGGVNRLKKTVPISTVGLTSAAVNFAWLESYGYASYQDMVEVQYSTDGTTWTTAGTFNRYNANQGWKSKSQVLPAGALEQATLYIAFKFTSAYGNDCYLDLATITSPLSICAGNTITYSTETGMTGYTWATSAGGAIISGAGTNSIDVLWNTAGAQTVSVSYTNGNACTASIATVRNDTVNALPVPTISGNTSVCINSTENVYTTEAGMTAYNWNIVGGTITSGGTATDNTATITWTASGAESISVNYLNSNGCTASSATVYNVTVSPSPVPTISGNTLACINSTENVYTTESGMTAYSWSIVGGTITSGGTATDNTATVTWTTAGAQSISVNYSNGNSCTATPATVYNVTINPIPVPTINGSTSACINSTGNVYTTESGMTAYSWSIVGGTITSGGTATDNTATVTWTTAGAQSISVNYSIGNNCMSASATVYNVTINPIPVPTITGSTSACINSTGNVYTTESGMTAYNWSVVGGTITSGGTATDNTATVTWTTAGSQSISVNYSSGNSCTAASATVYNVTVNPLHVPTISGSTLACLNSIGNVYTTEAGMTAYNWSVVGGTITSGGTAIDNTATITWAASGAGSISVNYTNVTVNGCTSQFDSVSVFIKPPQPNPEICIVSIDSTAGHYMVVWDKIISNALTSYKIYREASILYQYDLIGSVPYDSLSVFIDTISNPAQQAYSYELSAIDTCGVETALSSEHKTIHLSINQGMGTTYNLIWNNYEGFTVPSFTIYRGITANVLYPLTTLSSSLNSFTDLTPPAGYVYYQVEVVNPGTCSPSKSYNYSSSRSNIATNEVLTGITDIEGELISIYPNPASNILTIETPIQSIIEISNIEGQLIKTFATTTAKTNLVISEFSNGVYTVKVKTEKGIAVRKFVKE